MESHFCTELAGTLLVSVLYLFVMLLCLKDSKKIIFSFHFFEIHSAAGAGLAALNAVMKAMSAWTPSTGMAL